MEQAKFIFDFAISGLAMFVVFAILISLIGGAVGFVIWLFDKIKEEKSTWEN